ncbi:SDR family NAD(P)-dependent oxidoreductase [Rhizobium leguminosarum]|uniref:SDR family NAD(P)-dependent oxidoreductase n=1 Tax=Rhizobium TaxID=379 RepID=UPI0013EE8074|nr:SDR family NAD(P)-dependent oxidoreductase [Rhizobium leguminosarum]
MSIRLRPTAIVFGGDQGIGADIARAAGFCGHNVVIPFRERSVGANGIVAEIEHNGGAAVALFSDARRSAHVATLFRTVISAFGRCDTVIVSPTRNARSPGSTKSDANQVDLLLQAASLLPAGGEIIDCVIETNGETGGGPLRWERADTSVGHALRRLHKLASSRRVSLRQVGPEGAIAALCNHPLTADLGKAPADDRLDKPLSGALATRSRQSSPRSFGS